MDVKFFSGYYDFYVYIPLCLAPIEHSVWKTISENKRPKRHVFKLTLQLQEIKAHYLQALVTCTEHFEWTTLNIWVVLNILLNKAELRANIHPLRTRELNKCSMTGQTHWTTLSISKIKGNVESLNICSVKSLIAITLHWTRLKKGEQGSTRWSNALNILHSTNQFSEMFSTFDQGLKLEQS